MACRCSYCSCKEAEHDEYRRCPLFEAEICDVCCDYDVFSHDTVDVVREVTGKIMNMEEIAKICIACGKSVSYSGVYVDD